jgi:Zn-dependent protease with chaperone function
VHVVAASADVPDGSSRLDAFAFPADTGPRFALLLVLVLSITAYCYAGLQFVFSEASQERERRVRACLAETGAAGLAARPRGGALEKAIDRVAECFEPALFAGTMRWQLTGIALVLGIASLIFWQFPTWKLRRPVKTRLSWLSVPGVPTLRLPWIDIRLGKPLEPLRRERFLELHSYLEDLTRRLGIEPAPEYVWDPSRRAPTALAFGRPGRYYVCLAAGLVACFRRDRAAFHAVMLHELAHLKNGDVNVTYMTVAVWWAFVVGALISYGYRIASLSTTAALGITCFFLAFTALVYLSRNAVLRSREIYADVRAAQWEYQLGDSALRRVLEAFMQQGWSGWKVLWSVHPDPGARRRTVDEPQRLFEPRFWQAVATGIAATLALPPILALGGLLATPTPRAISLGAAAAVFLGVPVAVLGLAAGAVGVGVWRSRFVAETRAEAAPGVGKPTAGLACGLVAGQALFTTLGAGADAWDLGFPASAAAVGLAVLTHLSTLLVLTVGLWLFFRWVDASASAWGEVSTTPRISRVGCTVGLVLGATALTLWLAPVLLANLVVKVLPAGVTMEAGLPAVSRAFALLLPVAAVNPLTLVGLVALWAFPLAASCFVRARADRKLEWMWIGAQERVGPSPPVVPMRPVLALLAGATGGVVYFGLVSVWGRELARGWMRLTAAHGLPDWSVLVVFGVASVGMQALTAAVVAAVAPRLPLVHALCAAFVCACASAAGVSTMMVESKTLFLVVWLAATGNVGALLSVVTSWLVQKAVRGHRRDRSLEPG